MSFTIEDFPKEVRELIHAIKEEQGDLPAREIYKSLNYTLPKLMQKIWDGLEEPITEADFVPGTTYEIRARARSHPRMIVAVKGERRILDTENAGVLLVYPVGPSLRSYLQMGEISNVVFPSGRKAL